MQENEDMRQYAGDWYLRPDDLPNGVMPVEIVDVGDGKYNKPVATFNNGAKLSINASNAKVLCRDLGPRRLDWLHHPIELVAGQIEFNGARQPSILIRVPNPKPRQPLTDRPPHDDMGGDSIPF